MSFLNFIFKFWKIVNVHSPCNDLRFQDPLRSATRSAECGNLKQLVGFAGIAQTMHPNTVKRVNSLTKDNSRGLSHTCRGLFDLGNCLKNMNRGDLKIPGDTICQLKIYSYIIFHKIENFSCRSSFCNILMLISDMYDFDINRHHGLILCNTTFKNYCNMYSPRSCQEPNQKITKSSV